MKSTIGHLSFIAFVLIISSIANANGLQDSMCYGSAKNGKLENGVQLPKGGPNFVTYSSLGIILGRTYVHSKVYRVVDDAYKVLEKTAPRKIYMYAETSWKNGGTFWPHKTHQNGISVDFMVPVVDKDGKSVPLPTSPLNKFGYSIEFDRKGRYEDLVIDWEAMAAHLKALDEQSHKNGISIQRVIFDPALQPYLFKTRNGRYLKSKIVFSKRRSWVRHDEHYHVDFKVKCKPLSKAHK